jgi:deoxyribonuclease V
MGNGEVAVFSIDRARKAQSLLAQKVVSEDRIPNEIETVAGVDAAYLGSCAFGAVAVLDYKSMEVLESQTHTMNIYVPYVPTLLSFTELPVAADCIRKLRLQPDVFLVDAHGRAHPQRLGFASHLGTVLSKPTIGVAKNRLFGEERQTGSEAFLVDKKEVIGAVVTTRKGVKPVYVSVGHMVSLETAVKIVRQCLRGNRIPEPLRVAHALAARERKIQIAGCQQR